MNKEKAAKILLSLLVAFGLWLYVITVEVPEGTTTFSGIPVTFSNETVLMEERNLMVTSENVPTVTLELKGSRTNLNKLSNSNITIVVDLSQVYEEGQQKLTYKISYPSDISGNAFEVVNNTPSSITLDIEKRSTKMVPIVVNTLGDVQESYIADTANIELSVDDTPVSEVEIKGPASVVDQITQAVIDLDLTDRVETVLESFQYTLRDAEGNAVDAKLVTTGIGEIDLKMKIQKLKEVPLVVTVVDGGGATKETSDISIEPATIKIAGSEAVLKEIEEINLGSIDLGKLMTDQDLPFTINLPENVSNVAGVTEAVVSVKFPYLRTASYTITNIVATNVPEGYEVEFETKALTVKVRGPKEQVDAMKEADITATVDFTNAQVGSTTFTATITINSTYPDVGAVESYSVSATVREKTDEETKP